MLTIQIYFNYSGNIITNDRNDKRNSIQDCHGNSSIQKKEALFTSKLDLQDKKLIMCHIWSIALDGAKPRTLRKVGHKYPEMFKTWCWRKTEKIKFFAKTQPSKRDYNFVALQSSKLKTQPKCSTPLPGNPKVHYPLHISPLIFRVLSQISPVYILPVLSLRIIFM
jgi:hypothetical protein